jgi:glucan phosphoethanolaminetransferase (alkaline phosphatase superfamily)
VQQSCSFSSGCNHCRRRSAWYVCTVFPKLIMSNKLLGTSVSECLSFCITGKRRLVILFKITIRVQGMWQHKEYLFNVVFIHWLLPSYLVIFLLTKSNVCAFREFRRHTWAYVLNIFLSFLFISVFIGVCWQNSIDSEGLDFTTRWSINAVRRLWRVLKYMCWFVGDYFLKPGFSPH